MQSFMPKELLLHRHDLRSESKEKLTAEIDITDLAVTFEDVSYVHRAIFVDEDGTQKVLKDRLPEGYGEPMQILKRPLGLTHETLRKYLKTF